MHRQLENLGEEPPLSDARGAILANEFLDGSPTNDQPLLRLTEYELKLDAALRRTVKELRALQKDEKLRATGR